MGGRTRNIAFQLILQQFCTDNCTFLSPVFPLLNVKLQPVSCCLPQSAPDISRMGSETYPRRDADQRSWDNAYPEEV